MKPSPYQNEIFNARLILFLESEPGSNEYGQIELTKEQYIKLLNFLESFFIHPTEDTFIVPIVEESETTLEELNAHT